MFYVEPTAWENVRLSVRWHPQRLPKPSLPRNMIKPFGFTLKQQNPSSISVDPAHSRIKLNNNGKPVRQRLSKELKGSKSSLRAIKTYQASEHCVWPQSPSTIFHLVSPSNGSFSHLQLQQRNNHTFWRKEGTSMGSAFLCGMILCNPPPFHSIRKIFGLFWAHEPLQSPIATQMVNRNSHQTNRRNHAFGNAQPKGRVSLWRYCVDESYPKIFYNTLLLTVLFVRLFRSALNILEDLGPL